MTEETSCLPEWKGFSTQVIHYGQEPQKWNSRAVVPPISMATTFRQDEPGKHRGYEYSRGGNPTRECFESTVASIEGAKYGLAFSSGLGATTTMLLMLKAGDHVIASDNVYSGAKRLFSKVLAGFNVEFTLVDCTKFDLIEKAIVPGRTKMVWLETPSNPTLKVTDIAAVCKIVHKYEGIIVISDNTFMSPYFQRPLSLGSDISFSSVTKYISGGLHKKIYKNEKGLQGIAGHSDTVLGCIATNNKDIYDKLKFLQNATGIVPSPFDCYLANRGAKTLKFRMELHQTNAMAVASFLESHPMIEKVFYPGLKSHPQYELIKRQCTGFSGMVSMVVKGDLETARMFLQNVKLFHLAESLGGYESLIKQPAMMKRTTVPPEQRETSDTFFRLSVGLEDVEDLIDDLKRALDICL